VRNLVLLTAPIDFSEGGYLTRAVDKAHFPLDDLVETFGNIPPWFIQAGFKLLNPLGDVAKFYNLNKYIQDDHFVQNFLAIETWVTRPVSKRFTVNLSGPLPEDNL
jgi:polyhydroxyalkanoate synthase